MATLFDSSIIGSARDYNMFDAVDRGLKMNDEARIRQQQINYEEALRQYGAAAYSGDKRAQDILAQYDPAGMRAIRQEDETRAENKRIKEQELAIEMQKVYNEELAKMSEAERKAAKEEAERVAKGALGINDEATWNAYVIAQGGTPEEYPFAMKDQLIYSILPPEVVQDYEKAKKEGAKPKVDVYGQPVETSVLPAPASTGIAPTAETKPSGNMFTQPRLSFGDRFPSVMGPAVTPTTTESPTPAAPKAPVTVTETAKVTTPGIFSKTSRAGIEASEGFGWTLVDGAEVQVPLPGGPKDNLDGLKTIISADTENIRAIDSLLALPDDKLDDSLGWAATQWLGDNIDLMGLTEGNVRQSVDAKNIDTLRRALIAIGMKSLRAQGMTGTLTDADALAESANIANLDRAQTPEGFRIELQKLKDYLSPQLEGNKRDLYTLEKSRGLEPTIITSPNTKPTPEKPVVDTSLAPLGNVIYMNINSGKIDPKNLSASEKAALAAYIKSKKGN